MADSKTGGIFETLGVTGLQSHGGYLFAEYDPALQGSRGRRTFAEMADSDPVVGAFLFAIEHLLRQVEWRIDPGTDDQAGKDTAQFVDDCLNDMLTTWPDTLSEIMTFLTFGWSWHEIIYKRRDGKNSQFDDGKIGWHGWPMRGQQTLLRWEFSDTGDILGMWQLGPPDYREHFIPAEKSLLFRTTTRQGNPEGRSVLRSAYSSYYFKKRIQVIEGIGIERDLAGLPIAYVPAQIMDPNASATDQAALSAIKQMVTNIRRDEQEGIVWPQAWDRDTKQPLYELKLLTTGGTRQFNTSEIVQRYDSRILMSVMADFIQLGHEGVGSRALAETKGKYFSTAISTWLDSIAATINSSAIPQLLKLNGMDSKDPPRLEHGDVERANIAALGTYLFNLAQAGAQMDLSESSPLMRHLMAQADLPEPPDEEDLPADASTEQEDVQDTQQTKDETLSNPVTPAVGNTQKPQTVKRPPIRQGRQTPKAASEPDGERELMLAALDAKFGSVLGKKRTGSNGH